jgi:hypothetical protein
MTETELGKLKLPESERYFKIPDDKRVIYLDQTDIEKSNKGNFSILECNEELNYKDLMQFIYSSWVYSIVEGIYDFNYCQRKPCVEVRYIATLHHRPDKESKMTALIIGMTKDEFMKTLVEY